MDENKSKILEKMEPILSKDIDKEGLTPSEEKTVQEYWHAFGQDFINAGTSDMYSMTKNLDLINGVGRSASYNPAVAQDYLQDTNLESREPSITDLKAWLKNPAQSSSSLIAASHYMLNTVMQYKRITDYSAKMMLFNSDLLPSRAPKTGEQEAWDNGLNRCYDFLRKFKHRYEFSKVMKKVTEDGGCFMYINRSPELVSLVEIPTDWCYITGKWDWGYTWAIDLTYYDQFIGMVDVTPELTAYYDEFIAMREAGLRGSALAPYQYFPVPVEDGYLFSFNPLRAEIVPPYTPTMIDGMTILEYKNMLKQQMALDTVAIIAQIIPKDREGKPIITGKVAQDIVRMTAAILPKQTVTFSTPFEVEKLSFASSQNMNSWIGTGEKVYWNTSGATNIMNGDVSHVLAFKYSMLNDFGFVDHMYQQFENFVNIQLWLTSRQYKFNIKYFGNRYTNADDTKAYASLVSQQNMPVGRLYAMQGYEPYEIDAVISMEKKRKWRETMPLTPASQAGALANDGGRPTKTLSEMTNAGATTVQRQDNVEKVV